MKRSVYVVTAAALLALGAIGAAAPAQSQAPANPQMNMMAQSAARDAEISKLTEQMNHATGQAKVDAMAQLLNVLVQDRAAMHGQMQMMQHMHEMMMQGRGARGGMPGQMPHSPADGK
jgi:hypothetical protein